MLDPRYTQLADQVVNYSVRVQPGEHVNLRMQDIPDAMVVELIRAVRRAGGIPHVDISHATVSKELAMGATDEQYELVGRYRLQRAEDMQVHICFYADYNTFESAGVPGERMQIVSRHLKAASDLTCNRRKWTVLAWPTPGMAQAAGMSTEDFEDFYFRCCLADYAQLRVAMDKLAERMMRTDRVHITGPGTDLTFSIKGMPAHPCSGEMNIPDGEVFTAPIRDSVNGTIHYTAPTLFQGIPFDDIRLTFKDGKIIDAHCNGNEEALNKILDTDEGARYIGEFALGVNPFILQPMRDILFDEKIGGSFHFTPGQAYENCDNGNRSQVHWDMVCIQRADYGGGEIWFDDELIRKDGIFTAPALAALNPNKSE